VREAENIFEYAKNLHNVSVVSLPVEPSSIWKKVIMWSGIAPRRRRGVIISDNDTLHPANGAHLNYTLIAPNSASVCCEKLICFRNRKVVWWENSAEKLFVSSLISWRTIRSALITRWSPCHARTWASRSSLLMIISGFGLNDGTRLKAMTRVRKKTPHESSRTWS
jgi:hypothetical protein